jgi:DNA polymerase III sliding clamp (beta) subunit (PCNA family)
MKIKTQTLRTALELVKPGLANKEILEQSTKFAFKDGKLLTYNDETSVQYAIPEMDITAIVSADELYRFISKVTKDEIEITQTEDEVQLKAGRAKIGLAFDSELRLPIEQIKLSKNWVKWPEQLTKKLQFIAPVCSDDASEPKFQCVNVRPDGFLEASDRTSILQMQVEEIDFEQPFLLPKDAISVLSKYSILKFQLEEGWIHVQTEEGSTVSCRIITEDKFPDVEPFVKNSGENIPLPDTLDEVLERAIIFVDGIENFFVDVKIDGKMMLISSKNSTGWFKEKVKIEHEGNPIHFQTKPEFFRNMFKKTKDMKFDKNMLRFISDDWQYLTMVTVKED